MCKTTKNHAFYAAVNMTWYSLNSLEISLFNVHVCGIVFCLESITVASIEYGQLLAKCLYKCKRPFELWILFYIVLCNKYFPLNHLPDKLFPYGSIIMNMSHCTTANLQFQIHKRSRSLNPDNLITTITYPISLCPKIKRPNGFIFLKSFTV